MNFDFPEPYDLEVPRRIGEARQQLSREGLEMLERLLEATADPEFAETPEDFVVALVPLPRPDQAVLLRLNNILIEAYEASAREHQSWADLYRQMRTLLGRARELDPSLGDDATTGEAVAVLRRNGEPLGVSDEVLEMIVEVPEE
jgi:hypothetical protein